MIPTASGLINPGRLGTASRVLLSSFKTVSRLDDLPGPIGGVITLNGGAWLFTEFVDLLGNRIVYSGDTAILGTSSETAGITSTGLTAGAALITGGDSLPMQNIRITIPTGCKAVALDGLGGDSACDWVAVNFVGGEIGTIENFNNFIMESSAMLSGAYGLVFDGTIGTVAFETCLFSGPVGTAITIPATSTISRRFRIIHSSFVVTSGNTALNVSTSASIPVDGYILDTVNFSGGGTYTTGVQYTDNKALFKDCRGINNSGAFGHMTMSGNATVTPIGSANDPVKILGTTTSQSETQKFTHTNNRLTYTGAIGRAFRVTITASMTSTALNVLGLYVAKNDTEIDNSENYTTASSAGRAENAIAQTVVELATDDYIEAFIENASGANNITVTNLSVIAEALN